MIKFQYTYDGVVQSETSENCLYLSTYTPVMTESDERLLPVLVWIHGGSFTYGCGMFPIYGPEIYMKVSVLSFYKESKVFIRMLSDLIAKPPIEYL